MTLSKENIKLVRLTKDDLELARNWRNDPKISQYMFFKDHITREMQIKWFQKINNDRNYYFIIEVDNEKIGLTEIKNINYENMDAEAGIFIHNEKYLNGVTSYKIIFLLTDFAFYDLNIKRINIQIVENNKRAIRFNESLGYKKVDSAGNNYTLCLEQYEKSKENLKKIIKEI